jgi:nucleotidyltransferase/DNA polymerase involved in DNA repair
MEGVATEGVATGSIVLHVDADSFFCQVERLRNPAELQGIPIAVQQHQDIIAVDYAARAAGVHKHMAPAQVRHNYVGWEVLQAALVT